MQVGEMEAAQPLKSCVVNCHDSTSGPTCLDVLRIISEDRYCLVEDTDRVQ